MTYFTHIQNTEYSLELKTFVVKNILSRSMFISEYKPYSDLYSLYTINDSDTIYSIAESYYGSANFFWVISMFNELHDLNFDLPLSQSSLELYMTEKYDDDIYKIKYYIDSFTGLIAGEIKEYYTGYVSPPDPSDIPSERYIPVTFYDYENTVNEDKRIVKLLRKELLNDFILQFRNSLTNG